MGARFVNVDRETPMLFPVDMRDWIPGDHPVHFITEAVEELGLQSFKVNGRGTGNEQYNPMMMLSLLIYCYSTGRFHSRKIEYATYTDVAVRYICGGSLHPDHDTICKFRRENVELFKECFVKVLAMANRLGVLKRGGCVSLDGTKIRANASKSQTIRYGEAGKIIEQLSLEVEGLMKKAEEADSSGEDGEMNIPEEISRREERVGKLKEARRIIEEQFEEKRLADREEYEKKLEQMRKKKDDGEDGRSLRPNTPKKKYIDEFKYNFTDPESRMMRRSNGDGYEQLYSAQPVVDGEVRKISEVLVDGGYFNDELIEEVEDGGDIKVYAPVGKTFEPEKAKRRSPLREEMFKRLQTKEGMEKQRKRRQISEPVFGIITEVMGFRSFVMRGLAKVNLEWDLITLAYNFKRLFKLLVMPELLKQAGA